MERCFEWGVSFNLGGNKESCGVFGARSLRCLPDLGFILCFFGFVLEFYRLLSIFLEEFKYFLIFLLFLLPLLFEIHVGFSVLLNYYFFSQNLLYICISFIRLLYFILFLIRVNSVYEFIGQIIHFKLKTRNKKQR